MSQLNPEGVAEFIRLVSELSDFTDGMSAYERQFIYDNAGKIEKYGDKTYITEVQLDFIRKLYERIL